MWNISYNEQKWERIADEAICDFCDWNTYLHFIILHLQHLSGNHASYLLSVSDRWWESLVLSRHLCHSFLNTVYCGWPSCQNFVCFTTVFCHVRSWALEMLAISGCWVFPRSWRVSGSHQKMMMKTVRYLSSVKIVKKDQKILTTAETKHVPYRTCFHPGVSGLSFSVAIAT